MRAAFAPWILNLRNAFISKPHRIVCKAYSRENHAHLPLGFSARSGFVSADLTSGWKPFVRFSSSLFHQCRSSGGLRFGRTKMWKPNTCPASKAFTGQTIEATQQTALKYQFCAMELHALWFLVVISLKILKFAVTIVRKSIVEI